ncbi:MAG: 3-hydroxyacyl-CoA dehydrogenase family protein [Candidatus Bathyarchaeia archaeon]
MNIRKVACVGAGLIGHSWATLFSAKGFEVTLQDIKEAQLKTAMRQIESELEFLAQNGLMERREVKSALNRVKITLSIAEAVGDADYVQESVFETYELKKAVFRDMDAHTPEEVILASSSSGLLMTEIQKATARPERCVVAHPWNPPLLIPLVEIVPGVKTSKQTVETTYSLMKQLGKVPVILRKEVPGYIANRLQAALWREAIDLVDRGVASVEDVDRAVWAGPGLRWAIMGPHLTFHLGGGERGIEYFIDHIGRSHSFRWDDMEAWTEIPNSGAKKVVQGVKEMVGDRSMEELVRWRDGKLVKILKALGE